MQPIERPEADVRRPRSPGGADRGEWRGRAGAASEKHRDRVGSPVRLETRELVDELRVERLERQLRVDLLDAPQGLGRHAFGEEGARLGAKRIEAGGGQTSPDGLVVAPEVGKEARQLVTTPRGARRRGCFSRSRSPGPPPARRAERGGDIPGRGARRRSRGHPGASRRPLRSEPRRRESRGRLRCGRGPRRRPDARGPGARRSRPRARARGFRRARRRAPREAPERRAPYRCARRRSAAARPERPRPPPTGPARAGCPPPREGPAGPAPAPSRAPRARRPRSSGFLRSAARGRRSFRDRRREAGIPRRGAPARGGPPPGRSSRRCRSRRAPSPGIRSRAAAG